MSILLRNECLTKPFVGSLRENIQIKLRSLATARISLGLYPWAYIEPMMLPALTPETIVGKILLTGQFQPYASSGLHYIDHKDQHLELKERMDLPNPLNYP